MGRKATGRTTKLVRIPIDLDVQKLIDLYQICEVEISKEDTDSPRHYFLNQFRSRIREVIGE